MLFFIPLPYVMGRTSKVFVEILVQNIGGASDVLKGLLIGAISCPIYQKLEPVLEYFRI